MAINMPHCRFENTDEALKECYSWLDDSDTGMGTLSESERKAMRRLFKRMKRMIDDYGYLMGSKEA